MDLKEAIKVEKIEEAIIGAIFLNESCFDTVNKEITPEHFLNAFYRDVFKTMQHCAEKNIKIDMFSVYSQNKKLNIGEIAATTNSVATTANLDSHILIIKENYAKRVIQQGIKDVFTRLTLEEDVFLVLDSIAAIQHNVTNILSYSKGAKHIKEVLEIAVKEEVKRCENRRKGIMIGIQTGLGKLDETLCGLRGGEMIILAARPSQGKTSLGLHIAKNAAIQGVETLFFSLEMSDIALADRLILAESDIESQRYRNGYLSDEEICKMTDVASKLATLPFFIDDKGRASINYIRTIASLKKKEGKLGLIVIDYLQLANLDNSKKNREQEVSLASGQIKSLAKELDVPILVLSQLNREVEQRADKLPQLSDLRESGSLEQDADIVMLLSRPDEYGFNFDEYRHKVDLPMYVDTLENMMLINVAKNREGKVGIVCVKHNESVNFYYDF